MKYQIETFLDNYLNANTYLISAKESCIIVDPANNIKMVKQFVQNRKVCGILLTHGHYDHFKYLYDYLQEFNTKVYMHKNAYKKINNDALSYADHLGGKFTDVIDLDKIIFVEDNRFLDIGEFLIKCLYTPGHTNCSISYLIDDLLFSGDLLFLNSVGRWDLATGNIINLKNSLNKIKNQTGIRMIYPGHDEEFSLNDAFKHNQYLK